MTRGLDDPAAFRQALADRLRNEAARRGVTVESLRMKLVIERLLARLFADKGAPWLLKGGYSLELRYRPKARTTKDLDLTIAAIDAGATSGRFEKLRERLQVAADVDLGDHLRFEIGASKRILDGPPAGGVTFPVRAVMAGEQFGAFRIDVGIGDARVGEPEELAGDDLLAFAGIARARAVAISKAQQFAEKLHAYTLVWDDRENTRVKDLVDLVLLVERGALQRDEVRAAVTATFATRARHASPRSLLPPPASWTAEYATLALEAGIAANTVEAGFALLVRYWHTLVEQPAASHARLAGSRRMVTAVLRPRRSVATTT